MSVSHWICLGMGVILGYCAALIQRAILHRLPIGARLAVQTAPVGASEADLLPSAIMAAINASPVMQQAGTAKRYGGQQISWQVTFESAIVTGPLTVRLMCRDRGNYPWIICDVHARQYPQLQGLLPHTSFYVSGRIARISGDEIYLRHVSLNFTN